MNTFIKGKERLNGEITYNNTVIEWRSIGQCDNLDRFKRMICSMFSLNGLAWFAVVGIEPKNYDNEKVKFHFSEDKEQITLKIGSVWEQTISADNIYFEIIDIDKQQYDENQQEIFSENSSVTPNFYSLLDKSSANRKIHIFVDSSE